MEPDTGLPGVSALPTTVEEAAALLERAADDRSEYMHSGTDMDADVGLSVDMLRAAAAIIRTGDVRSWVPSWKWHLYGSDEQDRPAGPGGTVT